MSLLQVETVSLRFGGLAALTDVSLTVDVGTIRAVIGPNGAGKTSLFNAISGYERPQQGTIRLGETVVTGQKPHLISQLGLRRTFQNGGIFPEMTVLENVMVGADRTTSSGVLGILFALPGDRRAERDAVAESRKMLARVGIERLADVRARDLSFGQQRLVEITRALISHPRILLLDEPAVGLSQAERDTLATTLRQLASEGMAVLLVEHVIDLVMAVSDQVTVLNFGRVLAEGTPAEIRAHKDVLEAYLGSA
ncbi:MAG TPA: ABC transporter ATP-binding protein [Rhodopila sp.]|jgi:branched-chain amino acid transport system ATP-binding protein|nr:ABC transporter ATP-binding protein [Rhodopila sp.]